MLISPTDHRDKLPEGTEVDGKSSSYHRYERPTTSNN
jgi:hypothetical protein